MKTPYFAFYPQDWLSDPKMAQLTYEERGVYFELLCRMWTFNDGSCTLPDEDGFIARVLRVRPSKWEKLKAVLLDGPAPVLHRIDGKIANKRLSEEYAKALDKSGKASAAAKKKNENKNADAFPKNDFNDDKSLTGNETGSANAQRPECYRETDTETDSTALNPIGAEGIPDIPETLHHWTVFFQRQGYGIWDIRNKREVVDEFNYWIEKKVSQQMVLDAIAKAGTKSRGRYPISYYFPIVGDFISLRDKPAPARKPRNTTNGAKLNGTPETRDYEEGLPAYEDLPQWVKNAIAEADKDQS